MPPTTSKHHLRVLAAVVWCGGSIVLLLKGHSLLSEAAALRPGTAWPWLVVGTALLLGGLKARFVFSRSCGRNLARISALDQPKIWQFFTPGFFLALAIMIAAGATLSQLAHNDYSFLLSVAVLDLGIATALLGSSYVFWREKAFAS
jgi:hypothetical protein